jgi:hypothetical protein
MHTFEQTKTNQTIKNNTMTTTAITKAIEKAVSTLSYAPHIDKRRKVFKTALQYITETELLLAGKKRSARRYRNNTYPAMSHAHRAELLRFILTLQFNPTATSSKTNCTGIDYKAYHRPSSNGKGWVCIAPDEPGNNLYTEDAILVKFLSKKFND